MATKTIQCTVCGGDGSAELRRDGRTGLTECIGCGGSGTIGVRDDRTWIDQPDTVIGLPILLTYRHGVARVEIRKDDLGRWYVTAGTLFGSQTRTADTPEEALKIANTVRAPE